MIRQNSYAAGVSSGQAAGRGDLTSAGNHWTLLGSGKDDNGKQVFYRTQIFFAGRDKIHFEQHESGNNTILGEKE
jgi:hypothetical protein